MDFNSILNVWYVDDCLRFGSIDGEIINPDDYHKIKKISIHGSSIPNGLDNLERLWIKCGGLFGNKLDYIPPYLVNLIQLECTYSNIKNIPETLINLRILNCSNNWLLENLPPSLTNLTHLYCEYTDISDIPETYTNLEFLNCQFNKVSALPKTLKKLNTLNTQYIKHIPSSLTSLKYLGINTDTTIPNTLINIETILYHDIYRDNLIDNVKVIKSNLHPQLISITHVGALYGEVEFKTPHKDALIKFMRVCKRRIYFNLLNQAVEMDYYLTKNIVSYMYD